MRRLGGHRQGCRGLRGDERRRGRGRPHHARAAERLARERLAEGDTLILKGDPEALERAIATGELALQGQDRALLAENAAEDVGVIEAVVTGDSALVGRTAGQIGLHDSYGVNLLALSRAGERITQRLGDMRLRAGDVVVLQGPLERLPRQLQELGCLPLAERPLRLGSVRRGLVPLGILLAAMIVTATGLVPVAVAFFGAATLVMLSGALPPREAYDHIDWPILIMLGALIPVSEALHKTGATDLMAGWLSMAATALPPWGAVALIMVAAMAVTPSSTMPQRSRHGARRRGLRGRAEHAARGLPDGGCGRSRLRLPHAVGHQCNTLVMGPAATVSATMPGSARRCPSSSCSSARR